MSWTPIKEDEISKLLDQQYKKLSFEDKKIFNSIKITPRQAKIKRPRNIPQRVWLLAKLKENYIFFEDVEETFCIAALDESNYVDKDYKDYGFYDLIFAVKELIKNNQNDKN